MSLIESRRKYIRECLGQSNDTAKSAPYYIAKSVVSPIGIWRFLTPFDTVEKGDLYRNNGPGFFTSCWAVVGDELGHDMIGTNASTYLDDPNNMYELMRAVEGSVIRYIED